MRVGKPWRANIFNYMQAGFEGRLPKVSFGAGSRTRSGALPLHRQSSPRKSTPLHRRKENAQAGATPSRLSKGTKVLLSHTPVARESVERPSIDCHARTTHLYASTIYAEEGFIPKVLADFQLSSYSYWCKPHCG